jgi:hypothetical protein
VHKTRARAAPQVEHAGRVLQDGVAPKVSALLFSAARRSVCNHRACWRKLPASLCSRPPLARSGCCPQPQEAGGHDLGGRGGRDDVTPAAEMRDGQARTSTDADVNRPVRTS